MLSEDATLGWETKGGQLLLQGSSDTQTRTVLTTPPNTHTHIPVHLHVKQSYPNYLVCHCSRIILIISFNKINFYDPRFLINETCSFSLIGLYVTMLHVNVFDKKKSSS